MRLVVTGSLAPCHHGRDLHLHFLPQPRCHHREWLLIHPQMVRQLYQTHLRHPEGDF